MLWTCLFTADADHSAACVRLLPSTVPEQCYAAETWVVGAYPRANHGIQLPWALKRNPDGALLAGSTLAPVAQASSVTCRVTSERLTNIESVPGFANACAPSPQYAMLFHACLLCEPCPAGLPTAHSNSSVTEPDPPATVPDPPCNFLGLLTSIFRTDPQQWLVTTPTMQCDIPIYLDRLAVACSGRASGVCMQ